MMVLVDSILLRIHPWQRQERRLRQAATEGNTWLIEQLLLFPKKHTKKKRRSSATTATTSSASSYSSATLINATDKSGWTALHYASHLGHWTAVETLLDHGANVNAANQRGETPLWIASDRGLVLTAQCLLDHGADVDTTRADGTTALTVACHRGHVKMVDLLLQRGASIHCACPYTGTTALMKASAKGHVEIVKLLLWNRNGIANDDDDDEKEDIVNAQTFVQGQTALMMAAHYGHVHVIKVLLSHRANVLAQDKHDGSRCDQYAGKHHPKLFRLLKATIALVEACQVGNTPLVELLVQQEQPVLPNVFIPSCPRGETVLHYLCRYCTRETVERLLRQGANVTIPCRNDKTPLDVALEMGRDDIVNVLRKYSPGKLSLINKAARAEQQSRVLLMQQFRKAIEQGDLPQIEKLIHRGVSVNTNIDEPSFYTTPLQLACLHGSVPAAELLLRRGAFVNARGANGCTALHLVCRDNHLDLARLLLNHGAKVNVRCKRGQTPLSLTCSSNSPNKSTNYRPMMELLLDHNAIVDDSTFKLAYQSRNMEIIALFLDHRRKTCVEEECPSTTFRTLRDFQINGSP